MTYGLDDCYTDNIKLPKYKTKNVSNFFILEEIETDKFNTMEIITHMSKLKT